jgi:hypothetical protein
MTMDLLDGVVTIESFPPGPDDWATPVKLAVDRDAGRVRLVAEFDAIVHKVAGTVTFLAYRLHSAAGEFLCGQSIGGATVINGDLVLQFPREGVRLGWCFGAQS